MLAPAFDNNKVIVIFVLGGPGAGKGTQCSMLVQAHNFCHLSAGDLLRAEQIRQGSEYGELIRTNIREGKIVPSYVTLKLLEIAMAKALQEKVGEDDGWSNGRGRFLIDGFPRKMDQAELFDDTICLSTVTLFYDTTEDVLKSRLLGRAKTSDREDDNIESILKRFRTYKEETMPVIEHYQSQNKVIKIDSSDSIEQVYTATEQVIERFLNPVTHGDMTIT
ncbi:bifunctional uridylate/adenylate kinase [Leucoagaricus gongylophorus]